MSQILKLKRGSLEKLSTITGSLQKGEVIFASASSQISSSNGSAILFVTTESGSIQASNRITLLAKAVHLLSFLEVFRNQKSDCNNHAFGRHSGYFISCS
jgi:hypothetical protein